MRYTQERAASEELLRLTIQRMAPQPAAFSPHTYAVWYEYILGINPSLNKAIDRLLNENRKIDDDAIARLYQRYVSDNRQEEINRILREDVKQLLGRLITLTGDTDKKAVLYGDNLQAYGQQLLEKPLRRLDGLQVSASHRVPLQEPELGAVHGAAEVSVPEAAADLEDVARAAA